MKCPLRDISISLLKYRAAGMFTLHNFTPGSAAPTVDSILPFDITVLTGFSI